MCPYVYEHAWSPHLAAQAEGNPPELPVIQAGFQAVCDQHEIVTVEGSGGILCPLRHDEKEKLWLEDVVQQLGLASVIVAHAGLGTINSVVLTAEYMRARGLAVKGILREGGSEASEVVMLAHAVYLHAFPVKGEAFLRVELESAHARCGVVCIDDTAIHHHFGAHGVDIGVLHRP